jgi:hypothetical protein
MNEFHQISLKLQLGIDPAQKVDPVTLRDLWEQRCQQQLEEKLMARNQARANIRTTTYGKSA